MTSFSLEEAIQFRNRLQQYRDLYHYEWSSVRQRWHDLQSVWRDSSCIQFEQDFQQLIQSQDEIFTDLESHLQKIDRAIKIIKKLNETRTEFDSLTQRMVDSRSQVIPPTVSNKDGFVSSKEPNSQLTEQAIQEWQKSWTESSQTVTPFLDKIYASSVLLLSLFSAVIGSPPVTQVIKLSTQKLTLGVEFIVGDFQNFVDLNNETLGSGWSTLPDESVPKVIAKIMEDADELHSGNSEIADLIGDYADNDEEKRKRRLHEQKILNQLRSKYSQNSKRK